MRPSAEHFPAPGARTRATALSRDPPGPARILAASRSPYMKIDSYEAPGATDFPRRRAGTDLGSGRQGVHEISCSQRAGLPGRDARRVRVGVARQDIRSLKEKHERLINEVRPAIPVTSPMGGTLPSGDICNRESAPIEECFEDPTGAISTNNTQIPESIADRSPYRPARGCGAFLTFKTSSHRGPGFPRGPTRPYCVAC